MFISYVKVRTNEFFNIIYFNTGQRNLFNLSGETFR